MKDISVKAVAISSFFSFALMIVMIVVLGMIFASQFESADGGPGDAAAVAAAYEASWFSMWALLAAVAAGALGAAIAKRDEVLHGALSASLNVGWGIFCFIFLTPFTLFGLFVLALNPLLGALGGWLWLKRSK
tara:strand:- start:12112 stop:12510 length:399 start_codon:yes stop_codon:yes gene_type:complete